LKRWDFRRSYKDPQFVMHVITSAAIEFKEATGVHPIACRTANHHYSTHLPFALEKNGICIDGSVAMKGILPGKQHTAYYPDMVDIRINSRIKAPILEFPSFPCGQFNLRDPLLRIRIECLLKRRQPIFLSLYTHNWNVLTEDGKKNDGYLENLASLMNFLYDRGAVTVSWPEAKRAFEAIQRL
jgi:hypothetical protein